MNLMLWFTYKTVYSFENSKFVIWVIFFEKNIPLESQMQLTVAVSAPPDGRIIDMNLKHLTPIC